MIGQIVLIAPHRPLNDLLLCICCGDLSDPEQERILDKALWWSKLLSIHYHLAIDVSSEPPRRQSPAARLNRRLQNLERRAKKESALFWQEIAAAEIARKPQYYDLAFLELQEARLQAIETIEHTPPAVPINEVLDWLKRNSPMINNELDHTRELRIRSEEMRKKLAAMTPEELAVYREAQHERMKNDPIWQNAFMKERRQAPPAQDPIPEIDIENFQLLPTD